MTREEAIKAAKGFWGSSADKAIDMFVVLGMLKLDEPLVSRTSPEYRLYDGIFEYVPAMDFLSFRQLVDELGLKIGAAEASGLSDDR